MVSCNYNLFILYDPRQTCAASSDGVSVFSGRMSTAPLCVTTALWWGAVKSKIILLSTMYYRAVFGSCVRQTVSVYGDRREFKMRTR